MLNFKTCQIEKRTIFKNYKTLKEVQLCVIIFFRYLPTERHGMCVLDSFFTTESADPTELSFLLQKHDFFNQIKYKFRIGKAIKLKH